MSDPEVTIVIVAHSVRRELERCLASIVEHAGVPVCVVLVDNASTDDTREWVARKHPSVMLVPLDRNVGVAARKEGLARARGRYTMFLDSDAALTSGALPLMVRALDEQPQWGLVGPRLVYDDGGLQLSCRRMPGLLIPLLRRPPLARFFDDGPVVRRHLMADEPHDRPQPVFYVLGACQLFRSSLARAAGEFGRIFYGPDDIDWCIRIRDAGGEVVYFPEAVVIHSYRRPTSRRPTSRHAFRHLQAFYAFQWKYRSRRREFRQLQRELDRRVLAA